VCANGWIDEQIRRDEAEAMQEMGRYVRRIRSKIRMSQIEFARATGVSVDTLRNWEQGRRHPSATARALLKVLDRSPEAALAALRG
jgi:putative transcriptional regulator